MRIVALMTVRNEERYLERCIRHLVSQGVEICVIDNGSDDRTAEIAKSWLGRGVMRVESLAFNGHFELERILRNEQYLASKINADWFMHHDADEIREPPPGYGSLAKAVVDVDLHGYNAINFDEFVFVPIDEDEDLEPDDYVVDMKYYYFFEPAKHRRVNLWKNTGQTIDLVSAGGHSVSFPGRKISPTNFVMRHYIALSKTHAIRKFGNRLYSPKEIARGWHRARAGLGTKSLRFPKREEMIHLESGAGWNRHAPHRSHLMFTPARSLTGKIMRLARRLVRSIV